jgi:hypothetical protein
MGPKTVHALKPGIDETKCYHRRERSIWIVEHREFIHEMVVREVAFDSAGIPFVGRIFLSIPSWSQKKASFCSSVSR